jgi:hypothetical protein
MTPRSSARPRRRLRTISTLVVGAGVVAACQPNAPTQVGTSLLYVTGEFRTAKGTQPIEIRLDRQACFTAKRLTFRDASGLGVLVIERPSSGWNLTTYVFPATLSGARGYLNVSGVVPSFPLVRGTTTMTRVDADRMEGEIEWTLGEQRAAGISDTTSSRLRAVGRFSAVAGCPST